MKTSSTALLISQLSVGPLIHSGTLAVPTPTAWKDHGEATALNVQNQPSGPPPRQPDATPHHVVIHQNRTTNEPYWEPPAAVQSPAPPHFPGRGSYRNHARDKRRRRNKR